MSARKTANASETHKNRDRDEPSAYIFECEMDNGETRELCVKFKSEAAYNQWKELDFDHDHLYLSFTEAVQKKHKMQLGGCTTPKRKASTTDRIDLRIKYDPRAI